MLNIMSKLKIGIKQISKLLLGSLFASAVVSCTTMQTQMVPISSKNTFEQDKIKPQLLKLDNWQIRGVLGIIYNDKAESANYIYTQDGDKFSIKLYGPLGIGSVQIKGDPSQVTLENSKGQKIQAKDAKSLMLEQLGWYVPVGGLKYWVKGVAIPSIKYKSKLNQNNLTETLQQNNWNISYKNYQFVGSKYPLPSRIRMDRDNLIIKIVIKSWQI
ncbi:lipoprotein insertase outer membrane protein LolB [Francisella sp. LA112445]|uniref:lipoprotein insertase outer membrane protein LolB n=1 Tax=Francisella sp. LA112445 TaxID=1395624 RepID=UPI001788E616|nr:lipoprotein insertase outer membrane protein LolB [Francisella sp. LA112445]QIW09274.1 outer membrane lipoprotein LolB [Francisella sp. LA112445]